ncbi:MAG: glycosyltransferase family 9 protein [Candidatus Woesearchaeota archaeon]
MKILLFKTGAIGDTIMTTPMLRQLKKAYPKAKIDYLIGNTASQVLEGNPNISEIILFDPNIFFKKKILQYRDLIRNIRKRKYDVIFILDKHWIFNYTSKLFNIPIRIGFDRMGKEGKFLTEKIYYGNDKHEIYYYLDLLKGFKIKPNYSDNKTDLRLNSNNTTFANKLWKKNQIENDAIAIAPGGGKNPGEKTEYRNWPINNYIALIKKIEKKYTIILIGGKEDIEKYELIKKSINSKNIISIIGKCSIKESAAVMKKCKCVICNDTGTMHIAGAVNKNIISIFGPTRPDRKAPLWKESKSIWKDKDIYEKEYELYGTKSNKKFMTKISMEDIIECI